MSENAPYNLSMEDRGDYLYALVGGDVLTAEISRLYWDEIAAECDRRREPVPERLLVRIGVDQERSKQCGEDEDDQDGGSDLAAKSPSNVPSTP